MTEEIITKTCTKCQAEKFVTEFSKYRRNKSGLRSECKECVREYNRKNKISIAKQKKTYSQKNKESIVKYKKKYSQENKEYIAEWKRVYYQENKESITEKHKQYREEHKTEISDWNKTYYKTSTGIESHRRNCHKRRALKAGVNCEKFNHNEVFLRDGYICQLCGVKTRPDIKNQYHPKRPELDHIVPLSLGGEHTKQNTQCLCRQCNMTKNNTGVGDQLRLFG